MVKATTHTATGSDLLALLARPFTMVDFKVQATNAKQKDGKRTPPTKALMTPFIDARAVQARLDYVFGTDWSNEFQEVTGGVKCGITVLGKTRWDVGEKGDGPLGGGPKTMFSDSLKRAGVEWGIGRFLYDLPAVWVECNEYSKVSDTVMAGIRARYKKWTQNAATIKHYGEVLAHFLEDERPVAAVPRPKADEPAVQVENQEAPEPVLEATTAGPDNSPLPELDHGGLPEKTLPKITNYGEVTPRNVLWPQLLVALFAKDTDQDIKEMAAEMAGIAHASLMDREVVKAELKMLSPDKATAILATLKVVPDRPGHFSHAATGV